MNIEDINDIIYSYINIIKQFFASYGWRIVFCLIIFYYSRPYLDKFMKQRSLAQANDPKRKQILDEERKRIRMYQQLDVYKSSKEAKEKK